MLASIVIRTYNEETYLGELLEAIARQAGEVVQHEVVIVDSGSTDDTLLIAEKYGCRITHIHQEDFTFGRSLNQGCDFARGDILVFISGHCIPASDSWLDALCRPLVDGVVAYSYGKQQGKDTTKYSEELLFQKFYPVYSKLPQEGFFCNNANAAILRSAWQKFRFNEELTGLEDMHLAKLLVETDHKIGYVADAPVWHIHDESWQRVRIRYEREAYALQRIMPEVHFSLPDFFRYFFSGVLADTAVALNEKVLHNKLMEIILFRFNHYWGTYQGSREMKRLKAERKHNYFYPKDLEKHVYHGQKDHRAAPHESKQRTSEG
ncbi:MAG: glycosyltransferase [Pseudomonadota bacterium]